MGLLSSLRTAWWLKRGGLAMLNWDALKSRKILVLAAFVALVGLTYYAAPPEQAPAVVASLVWLAGTYLGVQGAGDVAAAVKGMAKQGDFKSRKFKATLAAGLAVTILGQIGAPEHLIQTIQGLAQAYLGAQGAVDFTRIIRNGAVTAPPSGGGQ